MLNYQHFFSMRPRTKLQKQVAGLFPKMRPLTETQSKWADEKCFGNMGYLCGHKVWCERCGNVFEIENPTHSQIAGETCPECGRELKVELSRCRKKRRDSSFSIITTCKGFQVLRFFEVTISASRGVPAVTEFYECFQNWIAPDGRDVVVGRSLESVNYNLRFTYSPFEVRESSHPEVYTMEGKYLYSRMSIIPELRLRGWVSDWKGRTVTHYRFMKALLTYPRTETLVKARQYALAEEAAYNGISDDLWPSVRICIRRGYIVKDAGTWRDMVRILGSLGKDIRNHVYVCPANLKEAHDKWDALLRAMEARREYEKMRKKLAVMDVAYHDRMGDALGIVLSDGSFTIRPLQSVTEFYEEGKAMHHCVYGAAYYDRPHCLIMTARVDGKRAETVEVDTAECVVRQSRGVCNSTTEWHDKIISLVMKNMPKMRDIFIKNNI